MQTDQQKEYIKTWKKENKDKVKKNYQKYNNKPEVKQRKNEYMKEYHKKHRCEEQEYRKINAVKLKENRKQYDETYKHTDNYKINNSISKHRSRSQNKDIKNPLTVQEWKYALEYFHNSCAYCERSLDKPYKEHFISVFKGGEFTKNNIIPACSRCNTKKQEKDPLEWILSQPKGLIAYIKIIQYFESLKG